MPTTDPRRAAPAPAATPTPPTPDAGVPDPDTALRTANTLLARHAPEPRIGARVTHRLARRGPSLVAQIRRGDRLDKTWTAERAALDADAVVAPLGEQRWQVMIPCRLDDAGQPTPCWHLDGEPAITNVGLLLEVDARDAAEALARALHGLLSGS